MSDTLQDALQPVLVRWTMGGAAAPLAPEGLRGKLGEDADEAELRLLAIAGQALGTLVVPEPSGDLQGLPDLPALRLPTMPDRLRPLAARVLARSEEWLRTGVLRLVESRGYVVHPGDWMPPRTADVPGIYAPWQDWLAGIAGDASAGASPEDRWDDLGPAGRRSLLASLRRDDPDAALALIRDKVPTQPAEHRLWMVQSLSSRLTERDRTFLEGLSGDRAPTVRAAASRLLTRLGVATPVPKGEDDPADEVGDFLRIESKGLLKRQRAIAVIRTRGHAHAMRRGAMMAALDARRLATALGVTDVELPGMWPWGSEPIADREFGALLLGTGGQEVVDAFERAVADGAEVDVLATAEDIERLSPSTVATVMERAYAGEHHLAGLVSSSPVVGMIDRYEASHHWRALHQQLLRQEGVQASTGATELLSLGVLVTARAAAEILERLGKAGIPSADPRLDTLRISAAL